MQILDIITKKKLGQPLTREEITFFARGAADKTIPDYQLAALLMAIRLNGMTAQETTDLTLAKFPRLPPVARWENSQSK